MARSLKRITVVLILAAAFLIAFLATTNATASLFESQNSSVSYTFTTTVVGVATNAVVTPLTLDGHSFTSSNIGHYTQAVQVGHCGIPSTVSILAGNFVPGDYVQFAVKISNTGTAPLVFQPYTYSIYFVTATGTIINPPYPAPITGYPAPVNPSSPQPWTLASFGTDTLSTYINAHLTGSQNWVMDFSYTEASTLPTTLAPGATFTYNLYVGLGTNVPYGIPNNYFRLSIPFTLASVPTPSPTPTHSPCPTCTPKPTPTTPTPTPKPTCTPTPTHTPCPTATSKPTLSPTPTHSPCPTCTPKPKCTPTPTPTCTPKPTPKPTHSR